MHSKFLLYLNSALAMENAALERVQRRVQQTILEEARQQKEIGEPLLSQSLMEEEKMFEWLRANAPTMFVKLWPQIQLSFT